MTPPQANEQFRMSETEFEALLARAAETGARRALHEVGLDGHDAAEDIRDLRSLLAGFRLAKQTAVQTTAPNGACSGRRHASVSGDKSA